jgi:Maleate cis-trans isomerase
MFGWRARIGVLLPPGNPTVEPELWGMAPAGVSLHFARIETPPSVGKAGLAEGMEERTRAYRDGLAGPTAALSQVQPAVVVLAHTASSYALGFGKTRRWLIRSRGWPAPPRSSPRTRCGRPSYT